MCGRAAQTADSLATAENILQQNAQTSNYQVDPPSRNDSSSSHHHDNDSQQQQQQHQNSDRYNLAPGNHFVIFHAVQPKQPRTAHAQNNENTTTTTITPSASDTPDRSLPLSQPNSSSRIITSSSKIWGLCPKHGTPKQPLEKGPGKHFANLMYNARSDTLYEKYTFSKLALGYQTCLWPISGYYEWKQDEGDVLSKSKGKQPYFVKSKRRGDRNGKANDIPLFIPGLWNRVKTGRKQKKKLSIAEKNEYMKNDEEEWEDEYIETFTMITTEACSSLRWMHHRQPIMIYNLNLGIEWIFNPSDDVLQKMRQEATGYKENNHSNIMIDWHPVTKKMSKISYKGEDCMDPIKIEKVPSVKSFFTATKTKASCKTETSSSSSNGVGVLTKQKSLKRPIVNNLVKGASNNSKKIKTESMKNNKGKATKNFFIAGNNTTILSLLQKQKVTNNQKSSATKKPKKGSITSFFEKKEK